MLDFFAEKIALDPGAGGACIADTALASADIVVSTTTATISGAIRAGTVSVVSHAALYIGSGELIEAIGSGVTRTKLVNALKDDVLAVAFRHPDMKPEIAKKIIAFATKQLGKPYDIKGVLFTNAPVTCRLLGPRPATFFCSKLVIEAYKQGGLPITTVPSQCMSPADIASIAIERLQYVGHLLGNPSRFPIWSPN